MELRKTVEKLTDAREMAALARTVLPRHTAKRLARLMGVEPGTVRFWLHRNFSRSAWREAAARLLVELDRQDAEERAVARRRLHEIAGDAWITGCRNGSEDGSGG
jgi:hypothetical protein